MGIFVDNFTWQQNGKSVLITVPMCVANKNRLNVICTSDYIKLSQEPYIFEACLTHQVDHEKISLKVTGDVVHIELPKLLARRWAELRQTLTKEELLVARKRALETIEQTERNKLDARKENIRQRQQTGVTETMSLEHNNRTFTANAKEQEKNDVLRSYQIVSNRSRRNSRRENDVTIQEVSDIDEQSLVEHDSDAESISTSETHLSSASVSPSGRFGIVGRMRTVDVEEQLRAVRTPGVISFSMTPRPFATAARESQQLEERAWLRRQSDSFRRDGALSSHELRHHENDPHWLKSRGDTFFQQGHYLASVNAYTHAIKVAPRLASVFSNRAACHLKLGNLHKALDDSSRALELLVPAVDDNRLSRLRCHVRRGAALSLLEAFSEALVEYRTALTLQPDNQQLADDVARLQQLVLRSNSDQESE